MRLLSLAPVAARARRAAGRCARFGDGTRGGLFGRARYRRGVQLPQSGGLPRAADVRRGRRAICPRGGLGAIGALQGTCPWRDGAQGFGRGDRGRARRGCKLRDGRILGRFNNCDYATIADAILHRGQWLWHLGAITLPDPGVRHRGQSWHVRQPLHLERRRHRSDRSGEADRRSGRACPRAQGAGADPADRPAP